MQPIILCKVKGLTRKEYSSLPKEDKKLYKKNDSGTYDVPEEIWLKELRTGKHWGIKTTMNPSEIGYAISGKLNTIYELDDEKGSQFKTALEIFHSKMGMKPEAADPKRDNDYVLFNGHVEEEPIAQKALRLYVKDHPGQEVLLTNPQTLMQCGERDDSGNLISPWLIGDPDRVLVIDGEKIPLEIKSLQFGAPNFDLYKNKKVIPENHLIQLMAYMRIMDAPYGIIAASWGYGEYDTVYYRVERDPELEADIVRLCEEFIALVENGDVPDISREDKKSLYRYMRRYYATDYPGGAVFLPPAQAANLLELLTLKEERERLKKSLSGLEKKEAQIMTEVLPWYRDASSAVCKLPNGDQLKLVLNSVLATPKLDEDKVKADYPELYAQYSTTFNSKLFKKEQPLAYASCLDAPKTKGEYTGAFSIELVKAADIKEA